LAAYDAPGPDFMLADLDVAGLPSSTLDGWRERFGLGLGPEFLGEGPCMIAGRFGRGRYVLSHAHLETPESPQANAWLAHILAVLTGNAPPEAPPPAVPVWDLAGEARRFDAPGLELAETLLDEVIELGIAHRLLFRRNPWLLGWRPGAPGFAVSNLRAMLRQAVRLPPTAAAEAHARENEARFLEVMRRFHAGACASFLDERLAATLSRFGGWPCPSRSWPGSAWNCSARRREWAGYAANSWPCSTTSCSGFSAIDGVFPIRNQSTSMQSWGQ
jgi:hypothetical protein